MKALKISKDGSFSRRSLLWVMFGKQRGRRRLRSCAKRSGRKSKVPRRVPGPKTVMSLMRRARLVSSIWLDKVLAGEREV